MGKLHSSLDPIKLDLKASELWKAVKDDGNKYNELTLTSKIKSLEAKRLSAWANFSKPKQRNEDESNDVIPSCSSSSSEVEVMKIQSAEKNIVASQASQPRESRAQDRIKGTIETLKTQIIKLGELQSLGQATTENKKQLRENKQALKEHGQKLKTLIADSNRNRKRWAEKAAVLKVLKPQTEELRET